MDTRSPEQRRRIMQSVGQKDTGPEMTVRRILHGMGYRYRLHAKGLPGKPDIVFAARKRAIFIHGCFWHGHDCKKGRLPKSRMEYWGSKLKINKDRDVAVSDKLGCAGWQTLTLWECETKDGTATTATLRAFLGEPKFRSTCET